MNIASSGIGLSEIRKAIDLVRAGKSDSLIDYTQPSRVEPIVLIDSSLLYYDGLQDVMQSLLSTFAGYYLQAVALSATVGKIEVMRHLDRLNPKRSPIDSALGAGGDAAGWYLAQESYRYGLPNAETIRIAMESQNVSLDVMPLRIAMEASHEDREKERQRQRREDAAAKRDDDKLQLERDKLAHQKDASAAQLAAQKARDNKSSSEFGIGKDAIQTVKELSNLSVGKLLSVEISDGQHKATIPVAIRLMASTLPTSSITHILSIGNKDISVKARFHGWRSGRLEFWRDLVFATDLIEAHQQNLMNDKDGVYRQILSRKRKNWLAAVLSGNPSVATVSNMAVIDKETADAIEYQTNLSLSNFKMRQQLLEPTSLMILAVVSKEYDRITFYYRGLAEKTEVSARDLKASNKGNGPDVADILKAYQMGHAPSL
jgi:hypothetical protein